MIEKRQFHRVRMAQKSALTYRDTLYHGQVENISLSGAVISFTNSIPIPMGDQCLLTVRLKGEITPLRLSVEVVHTTQTLLGIKFNSLDDKDRNRLIGLVERFTTEPEKLRTEVARIRVHIANYLAQ